MTTQQPEALAQECADYATSLRSTANVVKLEGRAPPVSFLRAADLFERAASRITELESQLAQRFDAADMATAAAQGFRDVVASLTAQAAGSVQEDAARLDFLVEQRAYVVSDPDACPGHWLHWAMPDGRTWVQGDEHPTPRAAIDAARKQGAR